MNENQGGSGPNNPLNSFPEYQARNKQSKRQLLLRTVKKFWYVIIIVFVAVAAIVFLTARYASAEASWDKAQEYFAKADYDKAAQELEGLSVPSDPDRLVVYSQTMLATRQLDPALEGYEKMYEDKKDPATKIIIGNIYNEKKQYDKSIEVYRDIINTDKTYVQAYVNLATVYRMQGEKDQAIAVAKSGVEANPSNVVLHELNVSMLLDEKGSEAYNAAVASLRELDPNDPLLESLENN